MADHPKHELVIVKLFNVASFDVLAPGTSLECHVEHLQACVPLRLRAATVVTRQAFRIMRVDVGREAVVWTTLQRPQRGWALDATDRRGAFVPLVLGAHVDFSVEVKNVSDDAAKFEAEVWGLAKPPAQSWRPVELEVGELGAIECGQGHRVALGAGSRLPLWCSHCLQEIEGDVVDTTNTT